MKVKLTRHQREVLQKAADQREKFVTGDATVLARREGQVAEWGTKAATIVLLRMNGFLERADLYTGPARERVDAEIGEAVHNAREVISADWREAGRLLERAATLEDELKSTVYVITQAGREAIAATS